MKINCKSIYRALRQIRGDGNGMYICVCKGVSEKDLNEVVKTCGASLEQIQNSCGAATDCGSCLVKLEKYLQRVTPASTTIASHSKRTKD